MRKFHLFMRVIKKFWPRRHVHEVSLDKTAFEWKPLTNSIIHEWQNEAIRIIPKICVNQFSLMTLALMVLRRRWELAQTAFFRKLSINGRWTEKKQQRLSCVTANQATKICLAVNFKLRRVRLWTSRICFFDSKKLNNSPQVSRQWVKRNFSRVAPQKIFWKFKKREGKLK